MKDMRNIAVEALEKESSSISKMASRLDDNFNKAVEAILKSSGKVIVTGVGKSGIVGKKIAVTLSSTGTPAMFMHACEAVHGDLGVYEKGNVVIVVSNSGSTSECLRLFPIFRKFGATIIALIGNLNSPMGRDADIVLDATADGGEADPLKIVPTNSAVCAMAYGDALVCALMKARNYTLTDYARSHPAGQLGRSITLSVDEVMHRADVCPVVLAETPIRKVVIEMTSKPLGAACVVDESGKLSGIITEGDLRRMLQKVVNLDELKCADIMTKNPVCVKPEAHLVEAINLMENRPSKISVLPVVDGEGMFLGLIGLHDIYQSQ